MATGTLAVSTIAVSLATANDLLALQEKVLLQAGWVRTPDPQTASGQVSTIPVNATVATQFWTPNDGRTSFVMALKLITYTPPGYSAGYGTKFGISLQIAERTDGAGALAGRTSPIISVTSPSYAPQDTPHSIYVSADSSRFTIAIAGERGGVISVERSRQPDGTATAEFVAYHMAQTNPTAAAAGVLPLGTAALPPPDLPWWGALLPDGTKSFASGSRIGCSPVLPLYAGVRPPVLGLVTAKNNDLSLPKVVNLQVYGAVRPYLLLPGSATGGVVMTNAIPGGQSLAALGMLWE